MAEILTEPANFDAVAKALEDAGIEAEDAEITMLPNTTTALSGEDAEKVQRLLDALEELDDVQDVYSNAELPEEEE